MGPMDRPGMPRPRRSIFRMMVSGLPETSWQVSNPSPFFQESRDLFCFLPMLRACLCPWNPRPKH